MPHPLQPESDVLSSPPLHPAAARFLIHALPPVLEMRVAGSVPCPSVAGMNHVAVVQVDPTKDDFGVLYEFVSSLPLT